MFVILLNINIGGNGSFAFPGPEGLVHISNLAEGRVEKVTDVCKEGDVVTVKATGVDRRGKIQLSIKDV